MDRRWALRAGCFSLNHEINHRTGTEWSIDEGHVYENWFAMLEAESENLDAVAVLTPILSHAEIVISALNAGYPVICEKALASSSSEAAGIVEAVKRNAEFLAVIYNYSGYPMVREFEADHR